MFPPLENFISAPDLLFNVLHQRRGNSHLKTFIRIISHLCPLQSHLLAVEADYQHSNACALMCVGEFFNIGLGVFL